jgi:outer membrane protein assembly factor BamB
VLLAGAVLVPVAHAEGAPSPEAAPLWGVDGFSAPPGGIDILESMMGHPFGAASDYLQLDQGAAWPDAVALRGLDAGALVYLNIESARLDASGVKIPVCWAAVAGGDADGLLHQWVDSIVGLGDQGHLLVSFNHEPDVSSDSQPRCDTDTPEDYRQAYHHVHSFFVAGGVTAPFAFVPSGGAYRNGVVEQYLPPAGDFSVIGTDAYNKVADPSDPKYRTPDQVLDPFFTWRTAHAPGLQMLIGELGENQGDPGASKWISEALALLDSAPGLLAVDWNIRTDPDHPYSPLLNQAALGTWLDGAGAPSSPLPVGVAVRAPPAQSQQSVASWPQFRAGPAHLGLNKKERILGRTNVGTLHDLWSGPTAGVVFSSPAVSGGAAYVGSTDHDLYAFDASGITGCGGSPGTCDPLWTGPTGGVIASSPAVSDGVVFAGSFDGRLYAFDAAGVAGCSGVPKTCAPLWTADVGGAVFASPVVAGKVVYVGSEAGTLSAFSAKGTINCSGTPRVCLPLWTAAAGRGVNSSPAVAGGVVYVGSDDHRLYAFDAAGVAACSGTPTTCGPLWTAVTGDRIASSPAVANGMVFVGSDDSRVYAFDAAGLAGCSGAPTICAPLWTAMTGSAVESSPAVAGGVVYVGSEDHRLYAFDAAGVVGCSGVPRTCAPLWSADVGGIVFSSPAVAHGVVYVGSNARALFAFDAAGNKRCSGSPKVCTPLVSVAMSDSVDSSPAIVDGVVLVGSNEGSLRAEGVAG